jgi:hypothetical protein
MLMPKTDFLKRQKDKLKEQIIINLDLLIGSIGKSPAMKYHNLTTKVKGKTVSMYVRKGLVPKAKIMTLRSKKVQSLLAKLSKVNWELLKLES